jgi:integrase
MTARQKSPVKTKHVGKSKRALPFNSQSIDGAGPIEGRQTEYRIEGERGLILVVTPENTGTYFFRYTVGHGKARKFRSEKLGRRDELKLADARDKAAEIRLAVGRGADPVAEGDVNKTAITFRELFDERMKRDGSKAARTLSDYERTLEADVFDEIGDFPADRITGEQIARVLETIEKRSRHAAHKARSAIGSTYRWALKRRKVKTNPTIGLGFTVQSKPRNRVLSREELVALWRSIDAGPGLSEEMRIILKLTVLTGQREGEVAGAIVFELRLDTANPKWRIPSERMKRKNREQIVPLSTQAVALFKRALELKADAERDTHEGEKAVHVFPADTTRAKTGRETRTPHINGESVSRAMARLRTRLEKDLAERAKLTGTEQPKLLRNARVHDLRKTVTTWLREERMVSTDVVDLILHHARKGVTASHYDFSTLEGPVRKALQDWSDHIEQVSKSAEESAAPSNVLRMKNRG